MYYMLVHLVFGMFAYHNMMWVLSVFVTYEKNNLCS